MCIRDSVHILADEFVGQISRVLYGNAVRKGGHAVKRDGLMLLHGIPHAGRARGLYTCLLYTSTDNGIETTVVAAMNDNDMVDIYVAVKDLEGSRINERTNLADVQLSGIAMTPMVQMVQFDEKTATATFRIEGVCGEDLNGKKITLSIGAVLLGRTEWSDQNLSLIHI